jgi:hypothetical protein
MTKWGIIGCGRIAHRFMQGLNTLPYNALLASYSRRPETVDAFVAQYGGKACSSAEELLASDIDAVYIATLPNTHADYSIKALNAGKACFMRKTGYPQPAPTGRSIDRGQGKRPFIYGGNETALLSAIQKTKRIFTARSYWPGGLR